MRPNAIRVNWFTDFKEEKFLENFPKIYQNVSQYSWQESLANDLAASRNDSHTVPRRLGYQFCYTQ